MTSLRVGSFNGALAQSSIDLPTILTTTMQYDVEIWRWSDCMLAFANSWNIWTVCVGRWDNS